MKVTREHVVVALLAAAAGLCGAVLSRLAQDEAPQVAAAEALVTSPAAADPAYPVTALPKGLGSASRARVTVNVVGRSRTAAAELELLAHDPVDGLLHLGHFRLDAAGAVAVTLPMGQYTAVAHDTGTRGEVAFEAPGDRPLELFLELEATHSARLRVMEKGTRRPLPQAVARLELGGEERGPAQAAARQWTSDGLGVIEVTDLKPDVTTVVVWAPDHLAEGVLLDAATDVEPDVELTAASWVSGQVRDENGTALQGVTVSSESAVWGGMSFETSTIAGGDSTTVSAADGSYRLMLPAGHRSLVAVDPAGRSATRIIDVAEATALPGVDFLLGVPLRLTGTVVDAQSGTPIADAVVQALAFKGGVVARGSTDLLGRFELDGLPDTQVNVVASQGRGARAQLFGVDPHQAEPLTLKLEAAAALWGLVKDQAGAAVPGARISAVWTHGEELGAVTDETGTWRLDDVRPGTAELVARVGTTVGSSQQSVYLTPGLALRTDLVVQLLGTVEGRVAGGQGAPPWRVLAMPSGTGRGGHTTLTRSDGSFMMHLHSGDWTFAVMRTRSFSVGRDAKTTVEAGRTVQVEVVDHSDVDDGPPEDFAVTAGTLGAAFDGSDGHVRFGFLISSGPAAKAGIQEGDELLTIGGTPVADTLDAYARAQGTPGQALELSVKGAGGERTLKVTLSGHRPAPPK